MLPDQKDKLALSAQSAVAMDIEIPPLPTYEEIFDRTIARLLRLPGRVEVGRTADTGNRYVAWFPFAGDSKVFLQFILFCDEIRVSSNVLWAGYDS